MAVLALGVAGAAAGYGIGVGAGLTAATGLTTAIGVGWTVGTITGQYLFGPAIPSAPDTVQEGPRLGDTIIKGGSYGQSIARVWGKDRIAAGIVWKQPIREEVQTEVIDGGDGGGGKGGKGGGGGGSTTITNYFYYADFAAQLCEGPVGIKRIWMNSKLVRDPDNGRIELDQFMTFYTGTPDQMPDPHIESFEGAGNVPGFRNTAYIVFNSLPLADFNNQVPNIEVEVVTESDFPPAQLESKNFSYQSPTTLAIANQAQYVDGATLWTISEPLTSDPTGSGSRNQEVAFTRVQWDIETGARLFEEDVTLSASFDLDGTTGAEAAQYIVNSPYIYIYALRPATTWEVEVTVIDVTTGTVVGEFSRPTVTESGGGSYTTGAWDGLNIYLGVSRFGNFVIHRVPSPFDGTGAQTNFLDLTSDPDPNVSGNFARAFFWDADGVYVLFADFPHNNPETFRRYDFNTNTFIWSNSGDPIVTRLPQRVNFKNGYLFVPYSDGGGNPQTNYVSYFVNRSTGLVIEGSKGIVAGDATTASWFFSAAFGTDQALVGSGAWLAFDLLFDNNVSDIIDEACSRSGLLPSEYDTSLINYSVLGYIRAAPMSGRGLIQALQRILAFDAVESDGILKFVPQDDQSGQTGLTIVADDLAAHMYGSGTPDEIALTRAQELEMPREIRVSYKSLAQDYDVGIAKIPNPVTPSEDAVTIELPAVLTETEAKNIARRFLNQTLWNRITASFAVPTKLIALEPTDIVTVSTDTGDYEIRITNIGLTAPSVLTVEGNLTNAEIYNLQEVSDQISAPPAALPPIVESFVAHLDIPIMREADATFEGHYSYGWGPGGTTIWPGATLYLTGAMGLWIVGTYWSEGKEATLGSVTAPAGSVEHPFSWDDVNTITVQMTRGTLQSSTDLDVQSGDNTAAVGIDGRWEIIGFVNVVDNGGGSYTLSRLMRARRGTEHNVGTGQAGDAFVLMDEVGLRRVNTPAGSTGLPVNYRYVPANDRIANTPTTTYTTDGTGLTPFAPARVEGVRDGVTKDLTVSWTPRSRCAIEGYLGEDYPVCEVIERYEVDLRLMAGGAVLRTLVVDDVSMAVYSLAAYVADSGDSGATDIPALHATVYQISATVSRGYPGEATV